MTGRNGTKQRNPAHHRARSLDLEPGALSETEERALRPALELWEKYNRDRKELDGSRRPFERRMRALRESLHALERDLDVLSTVPGVLGDALRLQNEITAGWSSRKGGRIETVPWSMESMLPDLRERLRHAGEGLDFFWTVRGAGGRPHKGWRFYFANEAARALRRAGAKAARIDVVLGILLERVGEPPADEYLLRQIRRARKAEERARDAINLDE